MSSCVLALETLNQSQSVTLNVTDLTFVDKANPIRVLHVDDDQSILEISKLMLMDLGNFDIDHASSVDEAFKKLETQVYDAVISDYEMPQKDGLQFLKEVREKKSTIPFILFTGKGREEVVIKALNLGADGYINKQGTPETVYGELAHEIVQLSNQNRTKKELALGEDQFRQFFSNVPSAVAIYEVVGSGEDFIFRDFNLAAQKIEKLSRTSVLGKRVTEVFPGVKAFGVFEVFHRVWKTGNTEYFPIALYHDERDSGTWRENWVMKLPNGNIAAMYNDISERKKTEQALCESQHKYHELVDSLPEMVFELDSEVNVVFANAITFEKTGYSKEDLGNGFNAFKLIDPKDVERAKENIKKVFTGNVERNEYLMVRKNGSRFFGSISSSPIFKDCKVVGVRGVINDLTEAKKTEEELAQKYEVLERVGESVSAGLAIIDKNYQVFWANSILRNLGVSSTKKCYQTFNHLDTVCPDCGVKKIFEQNLPFDSHEYKSVNSKGEVTWVELRVTPLKDKSGNVTAALELAVPINERKKNEELLKKSEEQLKAIISNAPIGIATSDSNKLFLSANPAFCKTLGYSEYELRKLTFKDITYAEDLQESALNMERLCSGQTPFFSQEKRYARKDGTIIDGRVTVSAIREEEGNPVLFVVELEDVTERKKAEQELMDLARFPSENPNPVMRIAKDNSLLYTNNAAKLFLRNLKIAVGMHSLPQISRHVSDVLKSGMRKNVEIKNGNRVFLFTFAPILDAGYVNVYAIDITDLKETEKALSESEERFRAITDSAFDAVVMMDDKQKIIYWNPAAEKIFGYTQREALGNHVSFLVPTNLLEPMGKGMEKLGRNSLNLFAGRVFETVCRHKNGRELPVEISGSVLEIRGSNYSVAIIRDATERKRMQKKLEIYSSHLKDMVELRTMQLKDANERLVRSERLAAIGELAGMVGHDLRNPLTSIKNAAYFLKKKGSTLSEDKTKDMLEIIEGGVVHSDKIINDLLDYAREIHLELQVLSLQKLLEYALCTVRIPEKVKIINEIPDKLNVAVDQNKIERVFINFVNNAIEAMPNGGTLTIGCSQTKDNIEISFADTGEGIPEEILPKLFTPLFTTKAQGMGFGLAICKRIVEAHGGKIAVETAKGIGTTFKATLPIET